LYGSSSLSTARFYSSAEGSAVVMEDVVVVAEVVAVVDEELSSFD